MFLMPVAVFVIVYSVPRFFELETKFVSRSLCATTSTLLMANVTSNVTTLEETTYNGAEDVIDGMLNGNDVIAVTFNGSDVINGSDITTMASTELSTTEPCPTVWEPEIGIKPLRFNKYYVSVSTFLSVKY
jgi:hypothetical protein